jgi:hypothetical protein
MTERKRTPMKTTARQGLHRRPVSSIKAKETTAKTEQTPLNAPFTDISSPPEEHCVYVLDGDEGVFYVGVTQDVCRRYIQHITEDGDSAKCLTIAHMKRRGELPRVGVLYRAQSRVDAELKESYFIDYFHALGAPLTNVALNLQQVRAHGKQGRHDAARDISRLKEREQKRETGIKQGTLFSAISTVSFACSCVFVALFGHRLLPFPESSLVDVLGSAFFFMLSILASGFGRYAFMDAEGGPLNTFDSKKGHTPLWTP